MPSKLLPPAGTPRILMFATLVNTFGNGTYLTASTLFLTRSVGLTPAQVALGLAAAALAGIVLTTPLGYVVDRCGAKTVYITALIALAACYCGMVLIHSLWSFTLLACAIAAGDATAKAAANTMIATAVPPGERVRVRAFLRSTNNAGIGLGSLAGGIPLLLNSRVGYVALLLANAATFVVAAAIVSRARSVDVVARPAAAPRIVALRDRPFLAFALVDGFVAAMYNELLSFALPLWLLAYTHASVVLVSMALLINTMGCVLLQLWASRGTHTAAAAIPVGRRGALVVAASCVIFAATSGQPSWLVAALVATAAVVHVLGELWLSSATWAVVFELAPDWAQGQYQGAYLTGRQIGNMATPPLLAALIIGVGPLGWLGVGAIFAVAGIVSPAIIRWGLRTRESAIIADQSKPLELALDA
jgi:MFS family permease